MKNTIKLKRAIRNAAIIALVAVIGFSMAACKNDDSGGSGGKIEGTWVHEYTGNKITFTGSNYSFTTTDSYLNTNVSNSSGTYTLASDGKGIAYKETSPGSKTYKGWYFPKDDPPYLTANFSGANAMFYKE